MRAAKHMQTSPLYGVALLILALIATSLSGCGFQLRQSYELAQAAPEIALSCKGDNWRLCQRLKTQLEIQGINISDAAPISIAVSPITEKNRTLTVTPDASVAEYDLRYQVRYQLTAKQTINNVQSEIKLRDQIVQASRQYSHDNTALLAQEKQTAELNLSLQKQLADMIFNRLSLVSKQEIQDAFAPASNAEQY